MPALFHCIGQAWICCRVPLGLRVVRWHPIFVGPQYGTCFMSPLQRLPRILRLLLGAWQICAPLTEGCVGLFFTLLSVKDSESSYCWNLCLSCIIRKHFAFDTRVVHISTASPKVPELPVRSGPPLLCQYFGEHADCRALASIMNPHSLRSPPPPSPKNDVHYHRLPPSHPPSCHISRSVVQSRLVSQQVKGRNNNKLSGTARQNAV
jgi:hypothetical protein